MRFIFEEVKLKCIKHNYTNLFYYMKYHGAGEKVVEGDGGVMERE